MGGNMRTIGLLLLAGVSLSAAGCGRAASVFRGGADDERPLIVADQPPTPANPADAAPPTDLNAASSALLGEIDAGEPQFVGRPVADDGDRPSRFVGVMNLYGEMPGSPTDMPDDALGNLRQVSFTAEGADFDVDISRDGQWLVFASTQHRPTADIYMKRTDGNTVTQVTSDPANDTMPAISPDGKQIAFASDRSGNWDIYIMALDGSQPMRVSDSPANELHPSWSPDGRQVAFCALGEQSGQWEMVVVDVANPARRRFIGYGLFPEFSPDGTKILFQRARYRGTRWFSIWTMDYKDGEATAPTEIAASTNAAAITPSWSPDGRQIAFATVMNPSNTDPNARPRAADLWVVNVDGTGRTRLTTDRFVNLQPCWGRDGRVYFVSNRTGTDNLWAVRPRQTTIAAQPVEPPADAAASVPTDSE